MMEDEKIEPSQTEATSQNIVSINQQNLEPEIAKKFQEINVFYQDSFNNYQKNIQKHNSKITKIKDTLRFENEKNIQDKEALTEAKNELLQEERTLDYLQNKFNQKIKSLEEFKEDNKVFSRKREEMIELLEEVEESELALLNKELQRLNLLENLKPKLENIMKLENNLNILEKEKENFERIGFHEITQITQKEEIKSIVDTVVM